MTPPERGKSGGVWKLRGPYRTTDVARPIDIGIRCYPEGWHVFLVVTRWAVTLGRSPR